MIVSGCALERFCLLSGYGFADQALLSFDRALISAEIGDYNLVKLSSILPPGAVKNQHILGSIPKGSLVAVAYAAETFFIDQTFHGHYASISVAAPKNFNLNGLIMEDHGAFLRPDDVPKCKNMAEQGMKDRKREVRSIEQEVIVCKLESGQSPIITIIKNGTEIFSIPMNAADRYVTLFSCCLLG